MLEEAVGLIRQLWRGGTVNHHGRYLTVERARIYSRPESQPPILVSSFGPKSMAVAARIGDGLVQTAPSAEAIESYRQQGGKRWTIAAVKVCWAPDEAAAAKLAYDLWPTSSVSGELSQELPTPEHFEQAVATVTADAVTSKIVCGRDPERHVRALEQYFEAGFDEVYVSQIGEDQAGYFDFHRREVEPRLGL